MACCDFDNVSLWRQQPINYAVASEMRVFPLFSSTVRDLVSNHSIALGIEAAVDLSLGWIHCHLILMIHRFIRNSFLCGIGADGVRNTIQMRHWQCDGWNLSVSDFEVTTKASHSGQAKITFIHVDKRLPPNHWHIEFHVSTTARKFKMWLIRHNTNENAIHTLWSPMPMNLVLIGTIGIWYLAPIVFQHEQPLFRSNEDRSLATHSWICAGFLR